MLEEDLLKMIVRGTPARAGRKSRKSMKSRKSRKPRVKNPYIEHVKKYYKAHPNISWKDALIKARSSYKGGTMAGVKRRKSRAGTYAGVKRRMSSRVGSRRMSSRRSRAGTYAGVRRRKSRAGSLKDRAKKLNQNLRDKKTISKVLRGLSAIPTPISGYAQDASLLASALGYGRKRKQVRRRTVRESRR